MLCQFTVKNFKSIRDEATFDMQAAAISEHEDRIIIDKDEKNIYRCQLFMVRMEEENPMFWRHCIPWWQKCYVLFLPQRIVRKRFYFKRN